MLLSSVLGGSFFAATPENPRFDLNSPDAWDAFGAERSSTGVPVGPESALRFSAWFRGVTLLARGVAKCPLHVRELSEPDLDYGTTYARKHPAYRLLRSQANELMTAFQFKLAITGHAVNRGNGYAVITRRGIEPKELLLLDPDATYPKMMNGRLWYVTTIEGDERKIPADDIFHLRGFGFDGIQGYPAWNLAKESVGLALASEKFKGTRFKNAARPSVVLQTDRVLQTPAKQELRQAWESMHTGIDNSHRTAILDNGLKAVQMSFTAQEMEEIEQAGLLIRDAANFLGIPSSKLCDVAGVKYASKEQDDQNFLDDGLDFWLNSYESEAWDKLLTEEEKSSGTHICQFDRDSMIRTNIIDKARFHQIATGGRAWETPNEARDDFGLEPNEDADSDKLLTPLNMGQGGPDNKPSKPAESPPTKPKGPQAPPRRPQPAKVEGVVKASVARLIHRVGVHAKKMSADRAKLMAFLAEIRSEHESVFIEALGETMADWLLVKIESRYSAVASRSLPNTLPLSEAVKNEIAAQQEQLPALACDTLFGDAE